MAKRKKRILVIEHDAEIGGLIESALDTEGYEAEWMLDGSDSMAAAGRAKPDVILVDLRFDDPEAGYRLLDALRVDPKTARIPVLAITTVEPLGESAMASYNVRGSLTKPFDIAELLGKVRETLQEPPLPAPPATTEAEGVLAEAGKVLAEHSREALFRWVQRLRMQQPWMGRSDLGLAAMLDSVPVLVEAVAGALQHRDADEFLQQNPELLARARQHAALRRDQGLPLASVIHEYAELRDEIWELFRRHLPKTISTDDLLSLERAVNKSLDRIIENILPVYLGDHQASVT